VADAAIENLDFDVVRTDGAAVNLERLEEVGGAVGGVGGNGQCPGKSRQI
jgi:hypothetical protein